MQSERERVKRTRKERRRRWARKREKKTRPVHSFRRQWWGSFLIGGSRSSCSCSFFFFMLTLFLSSAFSVCLSLCWFFLSLSIFPFFVCFCLSCILDHAGHFPRSVWGVQGIRQWKEKESTSVVMAIVLLKESKEITRQLTRSPSRDTSCRGPCRRECRKGSTKTRRRTGRSCTPGSGP